MLTKDQTDALGQEAAELVREYEQQLLNLIAEQMMRIDVSNGIAVNAAQAVVAIKAHALARKYRKKIAKAAQRDLDAAFYLNAAQELRRDSKAD